MMKGLSVIFVAIALFAAAPASADELVVMLLDTSGSMQGQEPAMISGVNEVLSNMSGTLMRAMPHWNGTFNVQIYLFSNYGRRFLLEAPLHSRPHITEEQYVCEGGTPLYDVIGDTLSSLPDGSTLVVATDGEDTTSQRFQHHQIVRMLDSTTLAQRNIHVIYVYKGVQAEREAVYIGMSSISASGSGTIAIGYQASSVGDAFVNTFANFGGQVATFRNIKNGD